MFDLTGKVALVTGAGQGIGTGIARQLGRQGALVAVNDLVRERAERAASELEAQGTTSTAVAFDVADYEAVREGIAAVTDTLGSIDILVNNAGIPVDGMGLAPFRDEEPDRWPPLVDLNVYGPVNCAHAVLPAMRDRGWGRILTISSSAHLGVGFGVSVYAAGKGAGVSFSRCLALEEAGSGITANSISLGFMGRDPGFGDRGNPTSFAGQVPVGRLGTSDEVGFLCVYLASEEAAYMTGQTLHLNGGDFTS